MNCGLLFVLGYIGIILLLFGSKLWLQPNIAFTLELAMAVSTRSDVTPPKVNRFG